MQVYSIPEIAQMLGVHRATVHRWVQKGFLPAIRVGTGRKIYLLPEEAVQAVWLSKPRLQRKRQTLKPS